MASNQSDSEYMRRSLLLHQKSHDPHRQVGAVIVDVEGTVLSEGTNAPPEALGFTRSESLAAIDEDPAWKYFGLEHPERNASHTAHAKNKVLSGATIYCTLFPCADCARAIVACGISRVVVPESARESERDEKWHVHYRFAHEIFKRGRVSIEVLKRTS